MILIFATLSFFVVDLIVLDFEHDMLEQKDCQCDQCLQLMMFDPSLDKLCRA